MANLIKRGKIYYLYWYDDHGKRRGRRLSTDKETALQYKAEFESKRYRKELNLPERDKSWDNFVKEYLKYSATNKAKSTQKIDRNALREFSRIVCPVILDRITPMDFEKFKAERLKVVSPVTLNIELRTLKAFFSKAVEWRYIRENPGRTIKQQKIPEKAPRFLSKEEIPALLNACDDHLRPVIQTFIYTGLRLSELLNLKWQDVNFNKCELLVTASKTGKIRIIPIHTKLKTTLQRLPHTCEYVFTIMSGSKLDQTTLEEKFRAAIRRAKIQHLRLHDLRHSFASHLIMNGADILSVSKLLGHTDIKTTMIYAHLSQEHLQEAVNKLSI